MSTLKALEKMPMFLSSRDLVKIGLVSCINQAYLLRKGRKGPSWVRMGNLIRYPKRELIAYLRENTNEGQCERQDGGEGT